MRAGQRALLAMAGWGFLAAASPLPTLHWTGTADVHAGPRVIKIQVETTVRPFESAVSRSRIDGEPVDRTGVMEITPVAGSVIFQGKLRDLGELATAHERQQYALYGLMLITHGKAYCIDAKRGGAPDTRLCFDRAGALRSGSNNVPDAETGKPIAQTFEFDGELRSGGVRWPKRIRIYQSGQLFFDLTLLTFQARIGG